MLSEISIKSSMNSQIFNLSQSTFLVDYSIWYLQSLSNPIRISVFSFSHSLLHLIRKCKAKWRHFLQSLSITNWFKFPSRSFRISHILKKILKFFSWRILANQPQMPQCILSSRTTLNFSEENKYFSIFISLFSRKKYFIYLTCFL